MNAKCSLWPHEPQHARPPCPSPNPGVYSNSCPLGQWCHPPSHLLASSSPPALNLSQHQGLFKGVSSSHQVAKVLELQLQHQSFTLSQSLLRFMSIESVMPSHHLILCHPFFLLPSIFPSIRGFSNELAVRIRWPVFTRRWFLHINCLAHSSSHWVWMLIIMMIFFFI